MWRCKASLAVIWWFKKEWNGIRPCVDCNVNLCEVSRANWDLCFYCEFLLLCMDQLT